MGDRDRDRDLVLEYTTLGEKGEEEVVNLILANVKGQKYAFGSLYPGVREGAKGLFYRNRKYTLTHQQANVNVNVNPTHCTISVDDQGQYWILGSGTSNASGVVPFLNSERVEAGASESRLLKSGDIISLGLPPTEWARAGPPPHPIYRVKLTMSHSDCSQIDENETEEEDGLKLYAESPLDNDLILSMILSYLPFSDLKKSRHVSKKFEKEASKCLEKKGKVSFKFDDSEDSGKVSRYLNEMKGMQIRTLSINLDSISLPGEKVLADLRNLLNSSHNFQSLFLLFNITKLEDFLPVSLILQGLGGKLVELTLRGMIDLIPEPLPPFPVMSNLKKFRHVGWIGDIKERNVAMSEKWAVHIVPLFTTNMEQFSCFNKMAEFYLPEILKNGKINPKGITIGCGTNERSLSLLLQVRTPLTSLSIDCLKKDSSAEECRLLEKLLFKHSQSLTQLSIQIDHDNRSSNQNMEVRFPSFPNLEVLELSYSLPTRVTWGNGNGNSLDYKKHFPSLRKLNLRFEGGGGQVLDSFVSVGCETVRDLGVPAFLDPEANQCQHQPHWDCGLPIPPVPDSFRPRMDRIREMFPNAANVKFFQRFDPLQLLLKAVLNR